MNPFGENFQLLVLQFCCMLATCIALNCANDKEVLQEQAKCFKDQGIDFELPEVAQQYTAHEMRNMMMETLIILKSRELCQRQDAYQLAIECDAKISFACIPIEQRQLIPHRKQLKLVLPAVCNQKQKVNFPCAVSKLKTILACGEPQKLPEGAKTGDLGKSHESMCKFFESTRDCQILAMMECGCNAVRVLGLVLGELIQPVTCPPVAPVSCGPVKVGYMESHGNQTSDHFAFPMFICVLLIVLEYSA